jgi:macrodomain Ter protein organizer (MatP/YcbG family)
MKAIWTFITKFIAMAWSWFMTEKAIQEVVVAELNRLSKKSSNTLDDTVVQMIADKLDVEIKQK